MAVAVAVALRIRHNLARMLSVATTQRSPRASSSKGLTDCESSHCSPGQLIIAMSAQSIATSCC